jgi:alcohol dehydrogenase class IV
MSVILNAPSVYRYTASACPERHLDGARMLGAEVRGALPADAGEVLASTLIGFMQAARFPSGLGAVGFSAADVPRLVEGTLPQQRVISNAPRQASRDDLHQLFSGAMAYW